MKIKSFLLCSLLLLVLKSHAASAPPFQWAQSGKGEYFEFPSSIAVDSQNNVYVTGGIGPTVSFGTNTLKGGSLSTNVTPFGTFVNPQGVAFLAKYSSTGNLEWVLQDNSSTNSAGRGLAIDSKDQIYLTGEFTGRAEFGSKSVTNFTANPDIFLAKFTPEGEVLWLRQAGGTNTDWSYGVAVDDEDNPYLAGFVSGPVTFGKVSADTGLNTFGFARSTLYLAKYDASGEALWVQIPGGNGTSTAYAITSRQGRIYMGGGFADTTVISGTTLVNTNTWQQNGFVAVYSKTGALEWATAIPAPEGISVGALALDGQNRLYVSGWFNGTASFGNLSVKTSGSLTERFITAMEGAGEFKWVKAMGANVNYNDGGLAGEGEGFVLSTGFNRGVFFDSISLNATPPKPGTFASGDMMVVKFDAGGTAVWGVSGGGSYDDGGATVAVSRDGGIYTAGWFRENAAFGQLNLSGALSTNIQTDIFVTRLGQGEVQTIVPTLTIGHVGDGGMFVHWPMANGYLLKYNAALSREGWSVIPWNVATANGTNSVFVPTINSALFLRLEKN